jgi:hypothetical protein
LFGVADKMQGSSVNRTTRPYGVQEAVCTYRRDLEQRFGSKTIRDILSRVG